MYAVRLVGTNNWIMRTPGHSKVMANAGSTWSSPPKELASLFNSGVADHIQNTAGVPSVTAANMFYRDPTKYLEVVEIKFEAV